MYLVSRLAPAHEHAREDKNHHKYGHDKSSGIEIRMADALAKINPTDPLILAKQAARRNLN